MSEPQGRFTQFQGNLFISHYYKIYFPAFIFSTIISIFFGDLLISAIVGVEPVNPADTLAGNSGQGLIHGFLSIGLLSPIFVIILSDMEIRKLGLTYNHPKQMMSKKMSVLMLAIGLGLYFLFSTLVKFLFALQFGNYFVVKALFNPGSPDFSVIFAADLIRVSNAPQVYSNLIILSFALTYISIEFILRGLIANDARAFRYGIVGGVFLPAFMQGVTYTYGLLLFTNPAQYFIAFLVYFFLGFFSGLIYWKTGRFWVSASYSVLAFLLQPGSAFQLNFLSGLPDFLGEYNLYDSTTTTVEIIGDYLGYINVALIIIAPFLALMAYADVWKILKDLYIGMRKYYLGIAIVGVSFILIDVIFSFFTSSQNPLGSIVGFILALVVVSFVLNYVVKILPPPTSQYDIMRTIDLLPRNELFPIDVRADTVYLDGDKPWWYNTTVVSILLSLGYLYLVFLAGGLRQIELLDFENKIRYIVFFGALPSVLLGLGSYFMVRSMRRGYFFQKSWRTRLIQSLQILLVMNLLIWTRSAAITTFSWSVVPLFVGFAITVWPPEIENAIKEFSFGFVENRIATFRWIDYSQGEFEQVYKILLNSQLHRVAIGAYISSAKLGWLNAETLIEELRSTDEFQKKIGIALALGIIGDRSAEGVLVDLLKDEELEVKKAGFWALGRLGTPRVLPIMISIIEGTPSESLVEIAEESILKIDPDFPLAGLRDNLTLVI